MERDNHHSSIFIQDLVEVIQEVRKRISRSNMQKQLETLDESYKRILNPHIYKVSLSEELKDLKKDFIEKNIK